MIMKYPWLLIFAVSCSLMGAGQATQVDFSKEGAEFLFDGSTKKLPEISEGMVTLPAKIETKSLPVEAGKKYKLEIGAEVAGDFVVETNDRAMILTLQSHQNRLSSTFGVTFFDVNGENISGFGGLSPHGFFISNQRKPYVSVFTVPAKATSLKVVFQSNGRNTRISGLQLAEETTEKTVNPNPDFRYGELNYSGWNPQRDGRLYTRPDGEVVFNAGYGGSSPIFPLLAGSKYHISTKGESTKGNGRLTILYYDQAGKNLHRRFLIRPTPEGAETELSPPPGTVMAQIVMYGGVILQDFKVTEVK